MKLPDPCEKCAPFGGNWIEAPNGMKRCDCPRGIALNTPPAVGAPVLSAENVTMYIEMLAAMPFFPSEAGARIGIGDELRSMCHSDAQAVWLVTRMRRLYDRWPGEREMRRVMCGAAVPLDGILAEGISEHYPEGIPSERKPEPLALPAAPAKRLAAGEPVSAAPSIVAAVSDLARAKDINRLGKQAVVRSIPTVRITEANRITQKDIERELEARRERAAREELS